VAIPCGLMAHDLFNGKIIYILTNTDSFSINDKNNMSLSISFTDIVLDAERDMYTNSYPDKQWIDLHNGYI
jgi:hypothetical protein